MLRADRTARISAEAARLSAEAGIEANQTTRAQISAYVTLPLSPPSTVTIADDGIVTIDYYVANSGQSTAHNAYVKTTVVINPMGSTMNLPGPNGIDGPFEITTKEPIHRISRLSGAIVPDFLGFFRSGQGVVIYIRTSIRWDTVFGDSRHQDFLSWVVAVDGSMFNKRLALGPAPNFHRMVWPDETPNQ